MNRGAWQATGHGVAESELTEQLGSSTPRWTQIKTRMRYHLTPVRMTIIKMSRNNTCWRGHGEKRILLHFWWECKLVQPLWRVIWRFLKKLQIELPYDPAISLLGIYPEKNIFQKDACTPVLIAMAKTCKQPKCLSVNEWIEKTNEWIKKIWYIYTMEYYSDIKKTKIMSFVATWVGLEIIILNELNQKMTNVVSLLKNFLKMIQMNLFTKQKQTHRLREQTLVTRGKRGER